MQFSFFFFLLILFWTLSSHSDYMVMFLINWLHWVWVQWWVWWLQEQGEHEVRIEVISGSQDGTRPHLTSRDASLRFKRKIYQSHVRGVWCMQCNLGNEEWTRWEVGNDRDENDSLDVWNKTEWQEGMCRFKWKSGCRCNRWC